MARRVSGRAPWRLPEQRVLRGHFLADAVGLVVLERNLIGTADWNQPIGGTIYAEESEIIDLTCLCRMPYGKR